MKVRIYDRNGHVKTMERRYADILVKMGRARYAPNEQDGAAIDYETKVIEDAPNEQDGTAIDYETKVIEDAPIRKRGRPAGKTRR